MLSRMRGTARRMAGARGGVGSRLLHSQPLLYFLFVLATANAYAFMWSQDFAALALLVLTGLVTSVFSKNMVVILCAAMVVANLVDRGARASFNEGFSASEDGGEDTGADKVGAAQDAGADKDKSAKAAEKADDAAVEGKSAGGLGGEDKMGEMKKQYNELLALQKQIVDGVKGVYEPLQKAEVIVSGMRGSMGDLKRAR